MTNSLQLPWPLITDNKPDSFPSHLQDNFDALAMAVGPIQQTQPTRVTTLPTVPFDGQEVYYVADATNGVVWHLKYRAASSSAYKWEFVGGAALWSEPVAPGTDQSTASATYAALTTAGPSITVPLAGDYDVAIEYSAYGAAGVAAWMSYDIGGTGATDTDSAQVDFSAATKQTYSRSIRRKTALAASTALVSKYRNNGGGANYRNRRMSVLPVRVG